MTENKNVYPGVSRTPHLSVTDADIRSVKNLKVICHASLIRQVHIGQRGSSVYQKLLEIYNEVQDLLLLLSSLSPLDEDGGIYETGLVLG